MASNTPRLTACVEMVPLASLAAIGGLASTTVAQAYLGWVQHTPTTAPSARAAHAMAHDAAHGRVVLFGGWSNLSASCCALADTWEWDGANWLPRQPTNVPAARAGAAVAYDTQRQRLVMFGGADFVNAVRGETVIFGGYNGTTYLDDTWVWNGTAWSQRTVATHPSPRKQAAMAYDGAAGITLLYGGEQGAGGTYGDTWVWNGLGWTQRLPGTSPGPRWAAGAAFDPMHGRIVLFGGFNLSGVTNEIWEWNGVTWSLRGAAQSPLPRQNPGFVFSPSGEAVMFGGLVAAGGGALADTWGFRSGYPAYFGTFGSGCSGSAGTPALGKHPGFAQMPWIGTTFGLRVTNVPAGGLPPFLMFGWSNAAYQGLSLPLALAALGMPGCSLMTSSEVPLVCTQSGSTAELLMPIPPATTILGAQVYGQAFVFDAGANPFGATLSNAGVLLVGSQ